MHLNKKKHYSVHYLKSNCFDTEYRVDSEKLLEAIKLVNVNFTPYHMPMLELQRIMVKTARESDRSWFTTFCVIVSHSQAGSGSIGFKSFGKHTLL